MIVVKSATACGTNEEYEMKKERAINFCSIFKKFFLKSIKLSYYMSIYLVQGEMKHSIHYVTFHNRNNKS